MTAVATHFEHTLQAMSDVVEAGAPAVQRPAIAAELIDSVETLRRLAAVVAVDALEQIHTSRAYYEHGHASARVMFAHVAGVSGSQANRLDKIRRMIFDCDEIAAAWRAGELSSDKAVVLGRAFANPRTQARFVLDQKRHLKRARRLSFKRFERNIAKWVELHDQDGPNPPADPSHENRNLSMTQDYFSKAWKLDGSLGSLEGSVFHEAWQAYVEAEFSHDWTQAEKLLGADTSVDALARTANQRRADALCQMAADAVNSARPSAPVKRVHNIVWTAESAEEAIRRWVGAPARILNPEQYNISDIDGYPIALAEAFADMLVGSFRRVVQNAAGVTLDMSTETRFFTGLARLGVMLATTECYWPGCHVPTSKCQMDHLRSAACGGPTDQINGLPACQRHNRFKERGYTVTRGSDGTISITTPTGELIR